MIILRSSYAQTVYFVKRKKRREFSNRFLFSAVRLPSVSVLPRDITSQFITHDVELRISLMHQVNTQRLDCYAGSRSADTYIYTLYIFASFLGMVL